MTPSAPPVLLYSTAGQSHDGGQWSFRLQAADGSQQLDAADTEPEGSAERLELLAVVRGLEALERPSRVTLVSPGKYVLRGISYGLEDWRRNDWTWERFGEMVPVKNGDLWRRLDHALQYHRLEVAVGRSEPPHAVVPAPHVRFRRTAATVAAPRPLPVRPVVARPSHGSWSTRLLRAVAQEIDRWRQRAAQLGTGLLPLPWLE